MSTNGPVGVFGKLPGLGDFLIRGLDPAFAHAWHGWLARELPAAHAGLGDGFALPYLHAPAWRFALAAGIAGPGMTGVLIPSLDAVGRPFPLTLAAVGAPAEAGWYAAVEALARAALDEAAWALGPWLAGLAALPAPTAAGSATGAVFWGEGSPFVAPGARRFAALPTGADFLRLLLDSRRAAA